MHSHWAARCGAHGRPNTHALLSSWIERLNLIGFRQAGIARNLYASLHQEMLWHLIIKLKFAPVHVPNPGYGCSLSGRNLLVTLHTSLNLIAELI